MTDPYLLFHLSDIHFGLEDNRALDWVKQEIADKRPDAFDLTEETRQGSVRMIGAGTLSRRLRSTPPSFNELRWDGEQLAVSVRNLEGYDTPEMMIGEVPEDATPPRKPDEPSAPVDEVPRTDPPVH